MTDAHCHLDNPQLEEVDSPILLSGIDIAITCGANIPSSKRCVAIANKNPQVYAAVGLGYEPVYSQWDKLKKELLEMGGNKKTVAIGECGLDSDNLQEDELLEFHLDLAKELDLPLVIHNRHQDERIFKILGDYPKVMMHCFTGSIEQMKSCVDRGWYISFGGIATFKKSDALREVVMQTPENRLLIETDSPYLSPEPIRGSVNTPANVKIVAEMVAKLRGVSIAEVDNITTLNVRKLFNI